MVEASDWVAEVVEADDEEEDWDWEGDWEEVEAAVWEEVKDWEEVEEGEGEGGEPPSNWAVPAPARSSATRHADCSFIAALVVKD